MMNNTAQLKKAMLVALEKNLGVVTSSAEEVGIGRTTHYLWMNTDSEYKKAVDEIEHAALDFAESKLFGRMKDDDTTAIIFFLKTKGKKRGYVERHEITGADNQPMQFTVQVIGNDNPILEEPKDEG